MVIPLKGYKSCAVTWFKRIIGRIYGTQLTEIIPYGFRSQIFVLRLAGLWPTADDSPSYKWLTNAYFFFVGLCYPMSMFVNIFYVGSVEGIMDNLFLVFSGLAIAVKAGNLYWRHDSIREIFRLHVVLLRDASREHTLQHDRIARINDRINMAVTAFYSALITAMIIQLFFSVRQERFFASTTYIPFDGAQRSSVYLFVLVYQVLNSWHNIITVASQDSLFLAMIITVCRHVRQLKERLQQLNSNGDDSKFYVDLIDSCKRYNSCLR